MKIMREYIEFSKREALRVKWQKKEAFTYPWHFHDEYEIVYMIRGKGTRFIADNIEEFHNGDLVFMGSNVPHFWKRDEADTDPEVDYIVVQFPSSFFKEAIMNYPEFHLIREMLERSSRGIHFREDDSKRLGKKLEILTKKKGFNRTIFLLDILQAMAQTKQYNLLSGEFYQSENHNFTDDRMTKVTHFITTNYLSKIELNKIAEVANLHPSAFCRFFKEQTGKSLSSYVNDMRISYACRLLIDGNMPVSGICFESGFNNLSNFNRIFRKKTGFSPTEYYLEYHGK